jgi:Cd(II)/Pb(II)-responsive transcriptional regulator
VVHATVLLDSSPFAAVFPRKEHRMRIGQLAEAAHCSTETIRYYEKAGLLTPPQRNASNYREYGPAHLERLRLIRNCRSLDMTHDEIRSLLHSLDRADQDCEPINRLLDAHIGHVDTRIAELQQLRADLVTLRQRCAEGSAAKDCGIIEGLSAMDIPARPPHGSHLG